MNLNAPEGVFIHRAMFLRYPGATVVGLVMRADEDGPWLVSVMQSYDDGSPDEEDCFEGPDGSDGCRDSGVSKLREFMGKVGLLAVLHGVPKGAIEAGDMLVDGDSKDLESTVKDLAAKRAAKLKQAPRVIVFPITEPAEA